MAAWVVAVLVRAQIGNDLLCATPQSIKHCWQHSRRTQARLSSRAVQLRKDVSDTGDFCVELRHFGCRPSIYDSFLGITIMENVPLPCCDN